MNIRSLCVYVSVLITTTLLSFAACADTPAASSAAALTQKAQALTDTNPQKAEALLEQAAALDPQYTMTYLVWGQLYEKQMQFANAEEKYKTLEALTPGSYVPLAYLGRVEQEQQHYAESTDYFTKAKTLHATVGILDGICHNFNQLKQWQDAVSACTDAIALDDQRYKKVDEYAYDERRTAYNALGEHAKVNDDTNTLKHNKAPFFIGLAVLFALFPVQCLLMNLAVFLRKGPLLYSSIWTFLPLILICVFVLPLPAVTAPQKLSALAFLVLILCIQARMYSTFGISSDVCKTTLISVLAELHLPYEEKPNIVPTIPRTVFFISSANIEIAITSPRGLIRKFPSLTFKQLNKDNMSKETVQNILDGLKKCFGEGNVPVQYDFISVMYYAALFAFAAFFNFRLYNSGNF